MNRPKRGYIWLTAIVVLAIVLYRAATWYTDFLWMDSIGLAAVWTKVFSVRALLALLVGAIIFAFVFFSLRLARRRHPEDITLIGKRLLPEEDREQIEAHADRALLLFALAAGFVAAMGASGQVFNWLQYLNGVQVGKLDPLFANDAGFYLFKLPFLRYVYTAAMRVVSVTAVAVLVVHLYQENIRVVGNTLHANRWARMHVLGLVALALVLKVIGYRLAQYNLLLSTSGGVFSGASYTDVHARLPVLFGMMGLAIVVAGVMIWTMRRRDFKLAGWALGGLIVVSLVAGSGYPWAIQRWVVEPNQLGAEQPYIAHNIEATRFAFALDQVDREEYPLTTELTPDILAENQGTLQNIRLWDYRPTEKTLDMIQALRPYYSFPGVDVDRYVVNDQLRQVSISTRQLDYAKIAPQWINEHLIYTHGSGVVVSPVNESNRGNPVLWVGDIPTDSRVPGMELTEQGQRIYYMASALGPWAEVLSEPEQAVQQAPAAGGNPGAAAPPSAPENPLAKKQAKEMPWVLVNTTQGELDYPLQQGTEGDNATNHYDGRGGVRISSSLRRLAFAIRYMDVGILLNKNVTAESRLQLHRYVPQMLRNATPFLWVDPDPYPVIHEGRVEWICDGYTTSNAYPYSAQASDIAFDKKPVLPTINYLRNAVKVVVDAYDGLPTYYVSDPDDPIIQTYRRIFPTLFTDFEQMPAKMQKHIRYPLLQFMVQAHVWGAYHINDPMTFYNHEDWWTIPPEKYRVSERMMEAYYMVMRLPGRDHEQFLLMIPYVLDRQPKKVAVGWLGAVCDPPNYGEMVLYEFPKGRQVDGPMMFEAKVDQNDAISKALTLWNAEGSSIIRGNTLLIPLGGALLYAEPLYLVANTDNAVPQIQQIILSYGDTVVMEPTLDRALARLFGRSAPPQDRIAAPVAATPSGVEGGSAGGTAPVGAAAEDLLRRALQLDAEADQAYRNNDLGLYQQKHRELSQILQQLEEALQ